MKKILFPTILITLLAAGVFARVANANSMESDIEDTSGPITIGKVKMIGESSFTIEKPAGEIIENLVSGNTRFRTKQEDEQANFSDLEIGMWVPLMGRPNGSGDIDAGLVVLLPEDFDPKAIRGRRVFSEVTKINNGQQTFTIATRSQKELTFTVNERTRYANGIDELKDLEKGMRVGVIGFVGENDTLVARVVAQVRINQSQGFRRIPGRVDQITEDTLTLIVRGGRTIEFSVTDSTTFRSMGNNLENLFELESGQVVIVVFEGDQESGHTALSVIATGEAFNRALHSLSRAAGEVQSAGGSHLTIQTLSGETLRFIVSEKAVIKGLGPEAALNDLKNGVHVLVLYTMGEDEDLYAQAILVGDPSHPPQGE